MRQSASILVSMILVLATVFASSAYALHAEHDQVSLDKLDDYGLCQSKDYDGKTCHEALVRWVEAHPADAFQAGKLTRKAMNHWAAIPFFTQAFEQKKGDCKDKDVKLAVVSALDLPYKNNATIVDQAKKIGLETCFDEMKSSLIEASTPGSYAFKNVCKDLVAKGAISGLKKAQCEKQ